MGREIRRVPPNWEHPKYTKETCHHENQIGEYIPLYDTDFNEAVEEFLTELQNWRDGKHPNYKTMKEFCEGYITFPDPDTHREPFTEEPTWYQAYQTVSEGTPVTPPFATEEELINYLVENGDFWYQKDQEKLEWQRNGFYSKPSRESATAFVKGGWAPSMIVSNTSAGIDIKSNYDAVNAL